MVTEQKIYLRQAQIGPMANFVYLIGDPETRKAAVVDPAQKSWAESNSAP